MTIVKMLEVDIQEYDKIKNAYINSKKKSEWKTFSRVEFRSIIDKATDETVCSESHRLGKSKYLIHPNFYNQFKEV